MNINVYDLNLSENSYWREQFEKYRHEVMLSSEIRAENFTPARFDIDKQLGTFLMYDTDNERIAGMCAVYVAPHWPSTVARLYNRSFVDPHYRMRGLSKSNGITNLGNGKRVGKLCHQYAYNHMIDVCKKKNILLGVATRENSGQSNAINVMHRCAVDKDPNWVLDDRYFLTMPYPNNFQCWQRLIYVKIQEHDLASTLGQIPNITQQEFKERFSG